jgi:hypothetical protein
MKTLIIHPEDRSTDFLKYIYRHLDDATVVTKNISRGTLHELIGSHDQIVMLGHGSPSGLFNVARVGDGAFAVGRSEVPLLQDKQCIFIWCHADQFVRQHGLKGLSSGMFISEVLEAVYCGVDGSQEQVTKSNYMFAGALGTALTATEDYQQILEQVTREYEVLAPENQVAQYNLERWQLIG